MKVVTGKVRGAYVNVFSPRLNKLNGRTEYSMTLLIPKSDNYTLDLIQKATDDAIFQKWNGNKPAKIRLPLRDGDAEDKGPEYKGHYFLNVKAKEDRKPGVVDRNVQPVLDAGEFRSGDYCLVSMNSFAYDQAGNRGVSFGLNNVQVLEKGDPLSAQSRAEDDFSVYQGDAGEWG